MSFFHIYRNWVIRKIIRNFERVYIFCITDNYIDMILRTIIFTNITCLQLHQTIRCRKDFQHKIVRYLWMATTGHYIQDPTINRKEMDYQWCLNYTLIFSTRIFVFSYSVLWQTYSVLMHLSVVHLLRINFLIDVLLLLFACMIEHGLF